MEFGLNGKVVDVGVEPAETVAEVLRERAGLTGTKVACGTGVCGTCTVLLDGRTAASCLLPAGAAAGREITTVEGLGGDHPVQRAFAAHDALQCGYCTPGFVVEAAAFTDRWRAEHGTAEPSREQIAEALAGHLCRCGAYAGIYAAVAAACRGEHDAGEVTPPRVEALSKITGAAKYTADIVLDGQLEGVIVRSPHAHAKVGGIRFDGPLAEMLPPDRVVRYVGQPVAAVAAPTRAEALAAAARVEVDYTELPAVLASDAETPVYPTKESRGWAPRASEGPLSSAKWNGNVRGPAGMSWRGGTAAKRIEKARGDDAQTLVEATYTTGVQAHTCMEPHGCVARWEGEELHLHLSTQAVTRVAEQAVKRWKLRPEQLHIVAEHVGGGFGSKVNVTSDVVAAVELSRLHGAPVRVVLSRPEELVDGGTRPGVRIELALLADADGKLSAFTMDAHGDSGVSIGSNAAWHSRFFYGNAPRRIRDYDHVTNRAPGIPFRGPGLPPMLWALEQSVDEMALRRGEDPIELRRRWDGNAKRHALYDRAAELPMWRERTDPGDGRVRRGVGVAAANYMYFLDPGTKVSLTVEQGAVVARIATQDIGTGSRTVIAEVVRSALDLRPGQVRVELGHSDHAYGPTSASSCTTPSIAPAAQDAADRLRKALAGRSLEEAEGLGVVGRRPRDRRGYVTPFPLDHFAIGRGFSGAVVVTEVEVDTLLGRIRPTRVWSGVTSGHVYAPRLARNQCEGGIIQGIGYALYEQRHDDPSTGTVLTANLEDYRIPGIADTPEIDVHFHTEGWDHVPGRGIGLGEVCTMAVAASIGNAVRHATARRPHDLPIRPDLLLKGIGA
ncbi:2Fe-2S iron-sulfur cluster binding domain-containing protein [Actinomadura sp. GC306]|uniref:molybdopterin-dependent oxidoreductase n=1 Tax=Actinomadura sp. GC306 TaxID=2530367 RepID=UPI00104A8F1F|nr:molybdopterin-dependent oxidoreductase [Actinomadura sp. GC306]TDC66439.1 2Fe-2S iron-sulfur cluster binding domain-containing protein [Actinomadura sp. GC306]